MTLFLIPLLLIIGLIAVLYGVPRRPSRASEGHEQLRPLHRIGTGEIPSTVPPEWVEDYWKERGG